MLSGCLRKEGVQGSSAADRPICAPGKVSALPLSQKAQLIFFHLFPLSLSTVN